MSERYYILKDGERIYRKSVGEIARLAQKVADEYGVTVPVYYDKTGVGWGGEKVAKVKSRKMRANPVRKAPAKRGNPAPGAWTVTGTKGGKTKRVKCANIGQASATRRQMLNAGFYPVQMKRPK